MPPSSTIITPPPSTAGGHQGKFHFPLLAPVSLNEADTTTTTTTATTTTEAAAPISQKMTMVEPLHLTIVL